MITAPVLAIPIEALQPERQNAEQTQETLDRGERSIANVEVNDRPDAGSLINSAETTGYSTGYFDYNCRCHDGHVLARRHWAEYKMTVASPWSEYSYYRWWILRPQ